MIAGPASPTATVPGISTPATTNSHPSTTPAGNGHSSRASRLRGLSLLRRGGSSQPRSNPSSPPISPNERLTLERSTSYQFPPANVADTGSSAELSSSVPGVNLNTPTHPPSHLQPEQSPSSSTPGSGMARLRRAFSSQNGAHPHSTTPATSPTPELRSNPMDTTPLYQDPSKANGGRDGLAPDQMPTIKLIPHQDARSARPSLAFAATSRTLPHEQCVIRVGRYSERDGVQNPPPGVPSAAPVGFKSKVVSRKHCEFWCSQGQWYIKDVKSSSGTFLNHIRLSQPNTESRPFPVNDGDVVQLGIDFKGGEEAIFRCVKIRIECNRSWQKKLNDFNMNTHKRLRELNKATSKGNAAGGSGADPTTQSTECAICLMSIAPCQSLFVAPCSHVWHFKCIRPMLNDFKTYPQFMCPNCRAVTDLEADVEDIAGEWSDGALEEVEKQDQKVAGEEMEAEEKAAEAAAPRVSELSGKPASAPAVTAVTTVPDVAELSSQEGSRAGFPAELASGMQALELCDTSIDATLYHSQSQPIEVPGSSVLLPSSGNRSLRPTTPGVADTEVAGNEGPLTPRNDAGPFVFDGSAGRASGRRVVAAMQNQAGGTQAQKEGLAPSAL